MNNRAQIPYICFKLSFMNSIIKALFTFALSMIIWGHGFNAEAFGQDDQSMRFVFYNIENLFDIDDDSLTNDEEFTPDGEKRWTYSKYIKKLDQLAKTLTGIGEWQIPAIVGLCEVENRNVLMDLTAHRLLKDYRYHIIHRDSPDRRGIDVALLVQTDIFEPLGSMWLEVKFPFDTALTSREILYVKGLLFGSDTLHIFINHWPSRWGGKEYTQTKRIQAARVLKYYTDSLFKALSDPSILIAGDFNDTPLDSSVHKILNARAEISEGTQGLFNLMFPIYSAGSSGTLKYRANWEVYDQIIVSGALLDSKGLKVEGKKAHIFKQDYLLIEDEKYMGYKPFRTYSGPSYKGGFSDHLPVYIDLLRSR